MKPMYNFKQNKFGDVPRTKRLTSSENIVGNILGRKMENEIQEEVHEAKEMSPEQAMRYKRCCRKY